MPNPSCPRCGLTNFSSSVEATVAGTACLIYCVNCGCVVGAIGYQSNEIQELKRELEAIKSRLR